MKFNIACGDVLEVLRGQPENSFDACLCDPPYHLTTGKKGGTGASSLNLNSPAGRSRISTGFMGKSWDGGDLAFCPETWAGILRVLKPGAMLMAFGGTRTHHRLMCAIEDAGFEIRDCCMWLYGSGFPKGQDIGKKAPGFAGYSTTLKPAWEPIIVAMKPLDGTYADNALKYGVAGLNIAAGRIESSGGRARQGESSQESRYTDSGGTNFAMKPDPRGGDPSGRWPANLILDEVAAAELDAQSGTLKSGALSPSNNVKESSGWAGGSRADRVKSTFSQNQGGASRFFYCAKASTSERGAGNNHPTVKPLKLTQYLATLLLPPVRESGKRRILVPFAGSGSELIGARAAGWDYGLGIELDPAYAGIAKKRLAA